MDALVGNTGLVGSNLMESHSFDFAYHSSNIDDAFGLRPDLLVFAGLRGVKFVANSNPVADLEDVREAMRNIERIKPSKIALISTVDVFPDPRDVDEDSSIDEASLEPYGSNRRIFEKWAIDRFEDCHVFRLPALYGKNLRKNFVFDMINRAPMMLSHAKFVELWSFDASFSKYYGPEHGGFHRKLELGYEEEGLLLEALDKVNFSSISFTDSRARFQFYGLRFLWDHLSAAMDRGIKLLNIATEPIGAGELYSHIFGSAFENIMDKKVPDYDFRTKHAKLFGGSGGYIFGRQFLLDDIKKFVAERVNK